MTQFAYRHPMLLAAALLASTPAYADDLALTRVVLSAGGVGYLEYEAQVEGDGQLNLDLPLDQVDDVLKSLVVYDRGGSVGEITLPGREPLARSLADLPFDRAALNSATALLNALQGAEVRIGAPRPVSGRLLHAAEETLPGKDGIAGTRTRVSIMSDAGLQEFALQDIDAIAFADSGVQHEVETALQRIAAYRTTGRRRLTVQLHGTGRRTVRLGYVVAMPLWKASYRLSLPADPQARDGHLQGWAVLENFSGQDWRNIELTLLSGNPVTFRQALYESYYVPRPTVPVEAGGRVLPPPDQGTVGAVAEAGRRGAAPLQKSQALENFARAAPVPAPAAPPPALIEAAAAAEDATQIAFISPYKITVIAGQSLVLPLLDREVPASRVDLYQPSVEPRHPLAAIELVNRSGTGLPPGVVTLYQQAAAQAAVYLGDARLAALPNGDKRLLSYAVDSKMTVDRSTSERRPIVRATVADGVLRVDRAIRWTTEYRVKAAGPAAPHLLLEQPRRPGSHLIAPDPKTVELAAQAYRIPLTVAADGTGSLAVTEEQPVEETIQLLDLDDARIGALVSSGDLSPKLRQALADLAARRQAVAHQRGDLARLKERRVQLVEDEKRLRDNLQAVGADPVVHKRLLDKFNETGSAIDGVSTAIAKTTDAVAAAEHELAAYVGGLML